MLEIRLYYILFDNDSHFQYRIAKRLRATHICRSSVSFLPDIRQHIGPSFFILCRNSASQAVDCKHRNKHEILQTTLKLSRNSFVKHFVYLFLRLTPARPLAVPLFLCCCLSIFGLICHLRCQSRKRFVDDVGVV